MKWVNESDGNPGQSVYYAIPEDRPNTLYVIQLKRGGTGLWRTFVRTSKVEALRTIYVGNTLKECKAFVEDFESTVAAAK